MIERKPVPVWRRPFVPLMIPATVSREPVARSIVARELRASPADSAWEPAVTETRAAFVPEFRRASEPPEAPATT